MRFRGHRLPEPNGWLRNWSEVGRDYGVHTVHTAAQMSGWVIC